MPLLERLATEYAGAFCFAKLNADEQRMIASQFGVQSLPTVILMKDGQPIDGFVGLKLKSKFANSSINICPKPGTGNLWRLRC